MTNIDPIMLQDDEGTGIKVIFKVMRNMQNKFSSWAGDFTNIQHTIFWKLNNGIYRAISSWHLGCL